MLLDLRDTLRAFLTLSNGGDSLEMYFLCDSALSIFGRIVVSARSGRSAAW